MIWKGDYAKKVPEGEENEEKAVEWGRSRQPNLREVWGASLKMMVSLACCWVLRGIRTCSLAALRAVEGQKDGSLALGCSLS